MNCEVIETGDCSMLEPASCPASADGGLGYSRHYAQRIRDLGQTSKDGWIKRLWNHMFGSGSVGNKKISVKTEDGGSVTPRRSVADHAEDRSLPSDISNHGSQLTDSNHVVKKQPHQMSSSDKHEVPLPAGQRQTRSTHDISTNRGTMPPQLINSPYLPAKEKVVYYRPVLTAKPNSNPRDGVVAAKLRFQRLSKSSTTLRASSNGGVYSSDIVQLRSTSFYPVKRYHHPFKRDSAIIQMEKRAKAVADRAIMVCILLLGQI